MNRVLIGMCFLAVLSCDGTQTSQPPPVTPTCHDGLKNGLESDIDCGGACGVCAAGKSCKVADDCDSASCQGGACAAPSCTDGIKNGDEADLDCGRSCLPCINGKACVAMSDCASNVCQSSLCVAPSCMDKVKNGTESDLDCGGSCAPCAINKVCGGPNDCVSKVCLANKCAAPSCTDKVLNADETDVDCGGSCGGCPAAKKCLLTTDCAAAGVCDTTSKLCRPATSCAEIHTTRPTATDGAYVIAPMGVASPYSVVCDMTRGGGGWTLLLKAGPDATLSYNSALWTDANLLNQTDLTTQSNNAKYQSFISLPVATLRGELDGYLFPMSIAGGMTAQQIFAGAANVMTPYPVAIGTTANWSVQPYCQSFGINTPYDFAHARFGWTANQEADCNSNDTTIGLGITDAFEGTTDDHGAGYACISSGCSQGMVNAGGNGLLWAK